MRIAEYSRPTRRRRVASTVGGVLCSGLLALLLPAPAFAQDAAAASPPKMTDAEYATMRAAEDAELRDVRENGPKGRLTLSMFSATKDAASRTTISAPAIAPIVPGVVVFEMLGPGDAIAMNGFGGPPAIFGDGSIHRYAGTVSMRGAAETMVIFSGDGGPSDRLTFASIAGVGYVYLRGQGRVRLPDGTEVGLPRKAAVGPGKSTRKPVQPQPRAPNPARP